MSSVRPSITTAPIYWTLLPAALCHATHESGWGNACRPYPLSGWLVHEGQMSVWKMKSSGWDRTGGREKSRSSRKNKRPAGLTFATMFDYQLSTEQCYIRRQNNVEYGNLSLGYDQEKSLGIVTTAGYCTPPPFVPPSLRVPPALREYPHP